MKARDPPTKCKLGFSMNDGTYGISVATEKMALKKTIVAYSIYTHAHTHTQYINFVSRNSDDKPTH